MIGQSCQRDGYRLPDGIGCQAGLVAIRKAHTGTLLHGPLVLLRMILR